MNRDDDWFKQELERHRQSLGQGDYSGFIQALLLCCWNDRALPDWVAAIVIQQAKDVFATASTGPGRLGNWRATYDAIQIRKHRAALAEFHLKARRKEGRVFVSELAHLYGYGKTGPGGANIVTRRDVFEFVSKTLQGTPARGEAGAVEESYKAEMRSRRGGE